jgi:MoxR-like ATPase
MCWEISCRRFLRPSQIEVKGSSEILEIEAAAKACEKIVDDVGKVYVGDKLLLRKLLAAALANGHVLFEDYPGLGKTLLVKAFAKVIGCDYKRIQFTPDLLPADIIGTRIWRQRDGSFELMKGPVFTNILLADEINRAPPKTQAALLESMEERQVSIEGETHILDPPFVVLATQNPIELEGTYPLPEAQMDRFMLRLSTGYARSLEEENMILERRIDWRRDDPTPDITPSTSSEEFSAIQELVETGIYVDSSIIEYINKIVRSTREHPRVEVGSSPRGGLVLLRISRALTLMNKRDFVTPDDVKLVVKDALSHRIILKVEYALEGVHQDEIIEEIAKEIPAPIEFHPR